VHGEHTLTGLDRILVDGQRVTAVLELVFDLDRLARELAELADGNETRLVLMGDRAAHDEAPRLDPDHDVDTLGLIPLGKGVDDVPKGRSILEERRDVLEKNALGREVLDVTDLPFEVGDVHRRLYYPMAQCARRQCVRRRGSVTPVVGETAEG